MRAVDSLVGRRAPLLAVAAAAAFALFGAPQAHAAACTTSWTGTGGPWNNPASWDNGVPDSSDVACVQKDGDYQIDIIPQDGAVADGTAIAKELHLGASSGTQTLEVQGRVADSVAHDASLTLVGGAGSASDVSSHGVIDVASGSPLGGPDANATLCAVSPLTNGGTISTGGGFGSGPRILGGDITNQATVTIGIDTTVPSTGCGTGISTLRNSGGTVTVGGSRTLTIGGAYEQTSGTTGGTNGKTRVDAGRLGASGGSGTFSMQRNSQLTSDVGAGITVNVEGTAAQHASVDSVGAMTNNGTFNLTSLDSSHGVLFEPSGGTFTNAGTINVLSGSGGIRDFGGTINNTGTMSIGAIPAADEFGADLHLTNTGAMSIAAGGSFAPVDLTQSGGTLTVDGTLEYGTGTLALGGGTLKGTGTVKAATVANNAATVAPGDSPGILSVQGDYTQGSGGTLDIEIQGSNDFDRLGVTGTATLGGALKVTTTGEQPGIFQILFAGQVNGSFATTTFTGQNYSMFTNATSVNLQAPPFNDTRPSITGAPRVGNTMQCQLGIWGGPEGPTFAFRWLRDGVPLAATTVSRKVVFADQGHKLSCRVTATNSAGSDTATSNTVAVPKQLAVPGRFTKKTLRASKAGDVIVPVANPNLVSADGTLTLRNAKGKVVGTGKATIAKTSTKRVKVHLKPGAFAKLRQKGQLKLRAALVLRKDGVKKTAKTTLTVNQPKP